MERHRVVALALLGALAAGCGGAGGESVGTTAAAEPTTTTAEPQVHAAAGPQDWPTFGRTPSRPASSSAAIAIDAGTAPNLRRQKVSLPGTVDSAPIYLHSVEVAGRRRDVFVMTTTYGRTVAVDAGSGDVVWTFTPGGYGPLAGTYRITNATPVSDRRFVYAASPDGLVHKLSLADGREAGGRWPVRITLLPEREKITSSFSLVRGRLVVMTGGYIGDAPPYQGHVVTISPSSGRIIGVTNTLCADRRRLIQPRSCPSSDSAIWARAGAVAAPDGSLLVATGNAPFDGRRDFGDSVVRVSGDGRRLLGSWTPSNHDDLDSGDVDLGSTGPVLLGGGSVLQSGKEGVMHVISFARLRRRGSLGRELQRLRTPGGQGMFTAPARWRTGGKTFIFATPGAGTAAYQVRRGRLQRRWANSTGGTSPIVAGGLLYVYDPGGALVVYRPLTGRRVASLPAGSGHWNSPVPGFGVIALPEGNANDHRTSGTLNLYRRP
jgi:outer membrane protein assembly factor BamB